MKLGGRRPIARFEPGVTHGVLECGAGPAGGTFVVASGSPLTGTTVVVPAHALKRQCLLRVGYDDGRLSLVSGTASGKVARVSLDDASRVPLLIGFRDVSPTGVSATVGYVIDDAGRLHALDSPRVDRASGLVWVACNAPALVTLVYVAHV